MAGMKVPLWEMILAQEREVERIDTWERVLKSEGTTLDPSQDRVRLVARRTLETLELVQKHEMEFVRMVNARREAARRDADAARRSTVSSSGRSTPTKSNSGDDTAPSPAPTPS